MNDILAIALLFLSALPFFNVHSQIALFAASALLVVGICLVGHIRNCERKAVLFLGAAVWAALWIAWLVLQIRLIAIGAQIMAASVALHSIVMCNKPLGNGPGATPPIPDIVFLRNAPRKRVAGFVVSIALFALVEVGAIYGMIAFLDADIAISPWTKSETATPGAYEETEENGAVKYGNVRFDSTFDNGTIDIFACPNSNESTPTLVYVGDGAIAFGESASNQNSVYEYADSTDYLAQFINAGYNVVSFKYANPPQNRYPVPVIQLNEAMSFLKANASKWHLNMGNVSFACTGTGGSIVGIYVLAQTNTDYANEIGVPQLFAPNEIRCIAFSSTVFDNARMGDTQSLLADFFGDLYARSYFDSNELSDSEQVAQSNVIEHACASMPPCFIDDGTEKTYDDQAKEFADKLTELGVPHEYNVYGGMPHDFVLGNSEAATDCRNRQLLFVNRYAK